MRKYIIAGSSLLTISGGDRTKNIEYSTTDGGLLYLYHEKSDSELLPQDGNKLLLDVKYFNENDSLLFNSQDISPRFIMDFFSSYGCTRWSHRLRPNRDPGTAG